jgi:hypothetical protein
MIDANTLAIDLPNLKIDAGMLFIGNSTQNVTANSLCFAVNGVPLAGSNVAPATGANTQVQFNDGGTMGANAQFTYDKATGTLTINGAIINSTFFSQTANNANYLAGVAAGSYATQTFVTSAMAPYVTNAYAQQIFVTGAALTSALGAYVAVSSLGGYGFVNSTYVAAALSPYFQTSSLAGYNFVNTSQLSANLANYTTSAALSALAYVNTAQLSANLSLFLPKDSPTYTGPLRTGNNTVYLTSNSSSIIMATPDNNITLVPTGVYTGEGYYGYNQWVVGNATNYTIANKNAIGLYTPTSTVTLNASGITMGANVVANSSGYYMNGSPLGLGSTPWVIKSAAYTLKNNDKILANTASGSFAMALPTTPTAGDFITVADGSNTWSTNNLTITSTSNIMSSNTSLILDVSGSVVELLYTDPVRGWVINNPGIAVTGTYIPPTFQKFLTVGTFTYVPSSPDVKRIRVRMMGGGGGGAGAVGVGSPTVYGGNGTAGGATLFGSILSAGGGGPGGAAYSASGGGIGGIPTITGITAFCARTGGTGSGVTPGGAGIQGAGTGGRGGYIGENGGPAPANSGGGGGGGGCQNGVAWGSGAYSGSSGGEGAEIDAWIMAPLAASYSVTIGAGGNGGTAGSNAGAGGAGGSGGIWIEEYYDAISAPIAQGSLRYDIFQNITSDQQAIARATVGITKKNFLLNTAMMISQENGSAAGTAAAYYPVDQFQMWPSNGGVVSVAQVASLTPGGSPNRIRCTVTTADASVAASDFFFISQRIEGLRISELRFGTTSAKMFILSFGVRTSVAGIYSVTFQNGAQNRTYSAEYTILPGEVNTDVIKSVILTGDQIGTWLTNNGVGLQVNWCLMTGTNYALTAGAWASTNQFGSPNQVNWMATNGNTFELFDVGLYEGSTAPAFMVPDYAIELFNCQRYWEALSINALYGATINDYFSENMSWTTSKRAIPTIVSGITSVQNLTAPTFVPNVNSIMIYGTATATATTCQYAGWIYASARM